MGGGLGDRRSLQGHKRVSYVTFPNNQLAVFFTKGTQNLWSTTSIPLLLSLQQLPVGTNLHIQSQLDVQELLILIQLLLHLLPHLCHFSVLLSQHAAGGVPLPRQGIFKVPHLGVTCRQLDSDKEEMHSYKQIQR